MIIVVIRHTSNQVRLLKWVEVHAGRKFHELQVAKKSQIVEQALVLIQKLYVIEEVLRELTGCRTEQRLQ